MIEFTRYELSDKGYRFLNPITHKVHIIRDLVFEDEE